MADSLQCVASSLSCDFFKLTETKGAGTGESFKQFPINSGDYILADRGYSTSSGIAYVVEKGAHVTVRVNTASLPLQTLEGTPFELLKKISASKKHRLGRVMACSDSRKRL